MEEHASVNNQGVGLGLSICKTLIEQMAGSVTVESREGVGTTFTIKFRTTCKITDNFLPKDCNKYFHESVPARRSRSSISNDNFHRPQSERNDSSMIESESSMNSRRSVKYELLRPNILVANDNAVILYGLEDLLKPSFNVVLAENGLEAVDRIKEKPREFFDAIVLDIQMPIMNGLEACVLIQEYILNEGIVQNIRRPSGNLFDDSNDTVRDVFSSRVANAWKQERRPIIYCFTGDLNENVIQQINRAGFNQALAEFGVP